MYILPLASITFNLKRISKIFYSKLSEVLVSKVIKYSAYNFNKNIFFPNLLRPQSFVVKKLELQFLKIQRHVYLKNSWVQLSKFFYEFFSM